MLATTINMHYDTLEAITRTARQMQTTRRDIVVRLLMRIMRDIDAFRRVFRTVAYQSDNPEGKWHCFSIRFKPDENEFFTDLRKFCKCSVSLLVAIAVCKYLDEILKDTEGNAYKNTHFNHYKLIKELVEGFTIWKIHWGITKKLKKPTRE